MNLTKPVKKCHFSSQNYILLKEKGGILGPVAFLFYIIFIINLTPLISQKMQYIIINLLINYDIIMVVFSAPPLFILILIKIIALH